MIFILMLVNSKKSGSGTIDSLILLVLALENCETETKSEEY